MRAPVRYLVRLLLAAAVVAAGVTVQLRVDPHVGPLPILLASLAAALLALTRSIWWRVLTGVVVAWWVGAGASALRDWAGVALANAWRQGRGQHPAQSLTDLALGGAGLVVSAAALLAVAGSLRIRRR